MTLGPVHLILRADEIYSMSSNRTVYREVAIRDSKIVAVSEEAGQLKNLQGTDTNVIDNPRLTVFPGLIDTHSHLLQMAAAVFDVQVDNSKSIRDMIGLIRQRADKTAEGSWIRTSAAWHEKNLSEKRFPTAQELDAATTKHPVLVKRGGHNDVVNSLALRLAGITRETRDPPGGTIVRDAEGRPNGWLIQSSAQQLVEKLLPPRSLEQQIDGLRLASLDYASHGITCVRDATASRDEMMSVYQPLWKSGKLPIRVRPMISIIRGTVTEQIASIDGLGISSRFGDDFLRVWGLKAVMDGGAEAAATDSPYANKPGYRGFLFWNPDDMVQVGNHALLQGWKIGTHCVGDRATRTVLDVYERLLRDNPSLPKGTLVLEHAFLADKEQRGRAIRLQVPVTIQHPPIFTLGVELLENLGEERAGLLLPVREWIDEDALVAAGSDYPAGQMDPMPSMWGMITRRIGDGSTLGPAHAVGRYEALQLYTANAARLIGEENTIGTIEVGKLADIVAYEEDPLKCDLDDLPNLKPVLTMVGGKPVYDPKGLAKFN